MIFKCIFSNEKIWILIKNSLKFVPRCCNNKITALYQIKARHEPENNPLSEPVIVNLLTRLCITQWVNVLSHVNQCMYIDILRPQQMATKFWKAYLNSKEFDKRNCILIWMFLKFVPQYLNIWPPMMISQHLNMFHITGLYEQKPPTTCRVLAYWFNNEE